MYYIGCRTAPGISRDKVRGLFSLFEGKLRRLEATMPLMEQKDRRLESRKKYFEAGRRERRRDVSSPLVPSGKLT
jgi:hypothetical protein